MTSLQEKPSLEDIPTHDFGHFLHALRTRRLRQMPSGARVVLSGGAAGSIYFEWFGGNYPSHVERHIGVEYFTPPPDPLPEGVEWLPRTLGDLAPVKDGEVDLVFAGQVIEHLWPDDMAGFLSESNRVLRPDGYLVLDSPTRFITDALAWTMPEHTLELEVDEIVELLELAGFVDIDMKGVWLCYDRERDQMMGLDLPGGGDEWSWHRRVLEAEERPRDSFIWWAEARNGYERGDADAVRRRVREIYDRARPGYFERVFTDVGEPADDSVGRRFRSPRGTPGLVLRGPGCALPPGRHEAVFRLGAEAMDSSVPPDRPIAEIEVTRDDEHVIANWPLAARDLPPGGAEREFVLPFELRDTAFNGQLRVRSVGAAPLIVSVPVTVRENVTTELRLNARPLGQDAARLRARMALRGAQRVIGWPARRLLDPRIEGLRNHTHWMADRVGDRIDARTRELGARIDALGERVGPSAAGATEAERTTVLPYVLTALGRVPPGSTILVIDTARGAVAAVLATLGYHVVSTPPRDRAGRLAGAVLRLGSVDDFGAERAARAMEDGAVIVLIGRDSDRARLAQLLDGWRIEDQTEAPPEPADGAGLTLTRAVLRAPQSR
jgi:SAM-dependent methyltransferase